MRVNRASGHPRPEVNDQLCCPYLLDTRVKRSAELSADQQDVDQDVDELTGRMLDRPNRPC